MRIFDCPRGERRVEGISGKRDSGVGGRGVYMTDWSLGGSSRSLSLRLMPLRRGVVEPAGVAGPAVVAGRGLFQSSARRRVVPARRTARGPERPVGVVNTGAELNEKEPDSRVGGASGMVTCGWVCCWVAGARPG